MIPTGAILIKDGVKYMFVIAETNNDNEPLYNLINLTTGIGFFPSPINEIHYIETLINNGVFQKYIDFIHDL